MLTTPILGVIGGVLLDEDVVPGIVILLLAGVFIFGEVFFTGILLLLLGGGDGVFMQMFSFTGVLTSSLAAAGENFLLALVFFHTLS